MMANKRIETEGRRGDLFAYYLLDMTDPSWPKTFADIDAHNKQFLPNSETGISKNNNETKAIVKLIEATTRAKDTLGQWSKEKGGITIDLASKADADKFRSLIATDPEWSNLITPPEI